MQTMGSAKYVRSRRSESVSTADTGTPFPKGLLTFTNELSGGRDASKPVFVNCMKLSICNFAALGSGDAVSEISPGRRRR